MKSTEQKLYEKLIEIYWTKIIWKLIENYWTEIIRKITNMNITEWKYWTIIYMEPTEQCVQCAHPGK